MADLVPPAVGVPDQLTQVACTTTVATFTLPS